MAHKKAVGVVGRRTRPQLPVLLPQRNLPGLDVDAAVENLARSGICVASGAACSSGSLAPSHVLLAMGLSYSEAKSTLRVSLSRETTPDEIELAATAIARLTA